MLGNVAHLTRSRYLHFIRSTRNTFIPSLGQRQQREKAERIKREERLFSICFYSIFIRRRCQLRVSVGVSASLRSQDQI